MIVYGINPVLEALRAGRVKELRVGDKSGDRLRQVLDLAHERGVRVRRVPPDALDRDARRGVHQGVLAEVEDVESYSLEDLVKGAAAAPLLESSSATMGQLIERAAVANMPIESQRGAALVRMDAPPAG